MRKKHTSTRGVLRSGSTRGVNLMIPSDAQGMTSSSDIKNCIPLTVKYLKREMTPADKIMITLSDKLSSSSPLMNKFLV